jgi:hypothetical protein
MGEQFNAIHPQHVNQVKHASMNHSARGYSINDRQHSIEEISTRRDRDSPKSAE